LRIVIIAEDLFSRMGGGEVFYRKLIADNPTIEFTYFRRLEPWDQPRAPNAIAIPVLTKKRLVARMPLFTSARSIEALEVADAYARSIAGQQFDICDVPDFVLVGPWLRAALKTHSVCFGAIVQSMHGVLSDSIRQDWDRSRADCIDLVGLEEAQYRDADHRYALSARYAAEWRMRTGLEPALIDPLSVITASPVTPLSDQSGPPQLLCVGRRERRKGNDLAIEIVAWMSANSHGGLIHIGPSSAAGPSLGSDRILAEMSERRGSTFQAVAPMAQMDLLKRYAGRSVVFAPVRYDTFNLVALEAVAAGVPLVISDRAGVCTYLADLPKPPPHLRIDPTRPEAAAARLAGFLAGYDEIRPACIEVAASLALERSPLSLSGIYQDAIERAMPCHRSALSIGYGSAPQRILRQSARGTLVSIRAGLMAIGLDKRFPNAWGRLRKVGRQLLRDHATPMDIFELAERVNAMPERSSSDLADKIELIRSCSPHMVGRTAVWQELARLHRLQGQDLTAAAYALRVMRLRGGDREGALDWVGPILIANGLSDIANVAKAQFGPKPSIHLKELIEARTARLQVPNKTPETVVRHDQRTPCRDPKVSVIVSLYNTGAKLARFLELLQHQTLIAKAEVELVLVDANSPQDEWSTAKQRLGAFACSVLYVRTRERVTIQSAWNLAVREARAPYLCFLGVDETLYPLALERLADELDRNLYADWAMASSIACEVDVNGGFASDKVFYDRSDAARDMVLLDTTYLSWVGGLYRRTLHDRFGYYDETFRASGDTEFKMRILPSIRVAYLPVTLGQFLDYPDERTTASVRAEIEDSLAWYAHRSSPGVGVITRHYSITELIQLLRWCGSRRKCYSKTPSTDVELGAAVAGVLTARPDAPLWAKRCLQIFTSLQRDLRNHDEAPGPRAKKTRNELFFNRWRSMQVELSEFLGASVDLRGLNDNRFDQHSWFWMS